MSDQGGANTPMFGPSLGTSATNSGVNIGGGTPPATPEEKSARQLIDDVLEEYREDRTKAACDDCPSESLIVEHEGDVLLPSYVCWLDVLAALRTGGKP